MKTANAKIVDVVPVEAGELRVVPEVSWERARELWGQATQGAEAIVELGYVLVALRQTFFNVANGRPPQNPSARGRVGEKGWQRTVEEELGITKQTAIRLIEKADALDRLSLLARGEEVTWPHSDGQDRTTQPTPENMALARQVIPDVVAGLMNPRRAWAGVCGEGSRAAMGKDRAPVDRGAVVLRAIRSIRAAMAVWTELSAADRYEIEMAWHDMVADMPAELVGGRGQAKGKVR